VLPAARRAGLEGVEKLLTANLTSTDTTERNTGHASPASRTVASLVEPATGPGCASSWSSSPLPSQARRSFSAATWTDGWSQPRVSVGEQQRGALPQLDPLDGLARAGTARPQGGHDGQALAVSHRQVPVSACLMQG
jgi:hypothetical protein